jgi:hypothetical protein
MDTLYLLVAAGVVLLAGELLVVPQRWRAWRRRRAPFRPLPSALGDLGVDAAVGRAAERYFVHVTGVADYPVRPDDELFADYGLTREAVEDALAVIGSAADCATVPGLARVPVSGIRTVADLALAVQVMHEAIHQPARRRGSLRDAG